MNKYARKREIRTDPCLATSDTCSFEIWIRGSKMASKLEEAAELIRRGKQLLREYLEEGSVQDGE